MNIKKAIEKWVNRAMPKPYIGPYLDMIELHCPREPETMVKKLKVYKVRPEAKLPVRAHPTDAGMDLFYCVDPNVHDFWNKEDGTESFRIYSHHSVVIPTGIKAEVPPGYMLEIKNKSGVATKKQLLVGACVVDSGFNGEIFVNLHNVGKMTEVIAPGEKIAQVVLVPIVCCEIEEVEEDNLNQGSSRQDGALGSTGAF